MTGPGFTFWGLFLACGLLAAADPGAGRVYVLASDGGRQGEVKAGEKRMFGESAVQAATSLAHEGYLCAAGDAGYDLTTVGRRAADQLLGRPPADSLASTA